MATLIQKRHAIPEIATWFFAAVLVGTGANIAGSGNLKAAAIFIAAFVGILLLLRPVLSLWFIIAGGLILSGLAQLYVPQLQFIRWSVGLLAVLLGMLALSRYAFQEIGSQRNYLPPIFWYMTAFVGVAIISSLLNYHGLNTFLFGLKGYFQVWGLFFALLMIGLQGHVVDRIPKALIALAFIQLPFALHQYFFLVPLRRYLGHGVVAEDVVVGTLGASPLGGGANAVLSALLLVSIAILAALYKRGRLSSRRLAACSLLLVIPIFLNANKVALVYLITMYLMLFGRELWGRPIRTLVTGIACAAIFVAILFTYSTLLSRSGQTHGWRAYLEQAVTQNTSADRGHGSYELNRWTSITFWIQEQRKERIDKVLFGHGAGATRDGQDALFNVDTLATREYAGVGIGLTAISAVLWELGVAGLIMLLGIFWAALRSASWLTRYYESDPWKAAVFEGLRVGVVILGLGWFVQASLVYLLPYQTLFVLIVGYLGYWHSKARAEISHTKRMEHARTAGTGDGQQSAHSSKFANSVPSNARLISS